MHPTADTPAATHHGEWCCCGCLWLVASVVVGSGGCQRWWIGGVGWQWWVMVATVVLGCDSRCRHRVLLDSVPGLTHPTPPPKKLKKKLVWNDLKWSKMNFKGMFLWILSPSWKNVEKFTFFNPFLSSIYIFFCRTFHHFCTQCFNYSSNTDTFYIQKI